MTLTDTERRSRLLALLGNDGYAQVRNVVEGPLNIDQDFADRLIAAQQQILDLAKVGDRAGILAVWDSFDYTGRKELDLWMAEELGLEPKPFEPVNELAHQAVTDRAAFAELLEVTGAGELR